MSSRRPGQATTTSTPTSVTPNIPTSSLSTVITAPISSSAPTIPIPHATGGPILPEHTYTVGEKGPELFMPNTSGTVIPNNKMGMNVTINFNGDINNTSNQSLDAIGKRIARQLELARFGLQS